MKAKTFAALAVEPLDSNMWHTKLSPLSLKEYHGVQTWVSQTPLPHVKKDECIESDIVDFLTTKEGSSFKPKKAKPSGITQLWKYCVSNYSWRYL